MIVIGDVHGHYDILMALMDKLPQTEDICFVGDLIDRGPDSKKVVDFVIKNSYKCVKGNHEEFIEYSFKESSDGTEMDIIKDDYDLWMLNGGTETLKSFDDSFFDYINFFRNLPLFIKHKNFLISHSYAENGENTDSDTLLWGRDFSKPIKSNIINIFGHTPHREPVYYHKKHLCLDTCVFRTGVLTAVDTETMLLYNNL